MRAMVGCNGAEKSSIKRISAFWRDQAGQDVTEYTLMLALVVILFFAIANTMTDPVGTIWNKGGSYLSTGAAMP